MAWLFIEHDRVHSLLGTVPADRSNDVDDDDDDESVQSNFYNNKWMNEV